MKSIVKKLIIYSMAGLMQVGLFASVTEAARYVEPVQHAQRDDNRQQDKERKIREENERHEKEMKRHPNESDREWKERQQRERERHERELRKIRDQDKQEHVR